MKDPGGFTCRTAYHHMQTELCIPRRVATSDRLVRVDLAPRLQAPPTGRSIPDQRVLVDPCPTLDDETIRIAATRFRWLADQPRARRSEHTPRGCLARVRGAQLPFRRTTPVRSCDSSNIRDRDSLAYVRLSRDPRWRKVPG